MNNQLHAQSHHKLGNQNYNKNHYSTQDLENSNEAQNFIQQDQVLITHLSQSTSSLGTPLALDQRDQQNQQQQQFNMWSTQKYKMPQNLILEMNDCLQRLDNLDDTLASQPLNINFQSQQNLTQTLNRNEHSHSTLNYHSDSLNFNQKHSYFQERSRSNQVTKQIETQLQRNSSNNLKEQYVGRGDIYSFERLNQEDVSLGSMPNCTNGQIRLPGQTENEFKGNSSVNMSHLQQSTPQLFRQELRNLEGAQSSPQINIHELSQQIKAALCAGSSPSSAKKQKQKQLLKEQFEQEFQQYNQQDASARGTKELPSQFSTNYKQKNPYKSRQISIHTNAFLATDAGDNSSNNQEIFSTARTTSQMGGSTLNINSHKRVASNSKSLFTQTNNNTFISYDNNMINDQVILQASHQNYPQPLNKNSNPNLITSDSNFNMFSSYQQNQAMDPLLLSQIQSQIFQTFNEGNEDDKLQLKKTKYSMITNTKQNTGASNTPHSSQNPKNFTVLAQENTKEQKNMGSDSSYGEEFLAKYQEALKNYQSDLAQQTYVQKKRLVTYDEEIKLRPTLKRKIKPLIAEPSDVPMNIYFKIVSYDGRMFKKFVCLSKGMRKHLLFYVFDSTFQIAKDFNRKYGQLLIVESRFLSLTPLSFNKEEGTRLEMSLRVRVKPEAKKIVNKSIIISNGFSLEKTYDQTLTESRINGEYQNVYQFDLYKSQAKRWMWIHKDECLFHGSTDARAYSMPIMPICIDDCFEVSVTLLNLMGTLDFNSVKWQSLKVEPLPDQDDVRDYNRFKNLTPNRDLFAKYFADLKRVCEVEDTVLEWFNEPYARTHSLRSHIKRIFDANQFKEQFEVQNVEVGGIDFSVWKVQLKALNKPLLPYKYYNELNLGIKNIGSQSTSFFGCGPSRKCSGQNEEEYSSQQNSQVISNEVKRSGFLIDRGQDIEVRGGDTLIVYLSMGGFEK
eukprot:403339144